MTVKQAIMNLLSYPMDAEINMYCTHDKKIEKADILPTLPWDATLDKSPTFYPNNSIHYRFPSVTCSS